MNKLILSLLACTFAIAAWANPSGKYHVREAYVHMIDINAQNKTFADGKHMVIKPGYGEFGPNCEVSANPTGTISLYNLIGEEVTLNCQYDEATKRLTVPIQQVTVNYEGQVINGVICGGVEGYSDAQELMNYLDGHSLMVPSNTLASVLIYDEATNTLTAETPLLAYTLQTIFGAEIRIALACVSELKVEKITVDANADQRKLQDLKDKVEAAALEYSAYVNKTEYNALMKTISDWSRKVNEALNEALNNGTEYKTPWTEDEIAALEKSIDDFIQRLADAKEADANQQVVAEITKQANADREKVQNLRHEWEEVLSELNKQYPGFTLAFDKANIDTKFSKVSSDIDAAQKKAVEELGEYVSPSVDSALSEIRGLIQKYKTDVETEVNRIKHNAEEAAKADRTTVANARQIAENAINATDSKYPAFANEADRSDIYGRYDKLMSDINAAEEKAINSLTTYVSPSVAQSLVEIDALVTKYQREVAAAAETAKTEATKLADADKATLSSLVDEIEVISAKYGPMSCIDTQKLRDLNTTIQELRGKIDTAVNNVYTVGSYQTPLTESELQNLRGEIAALEADCNTRLVAAIDKAAKTDLDKVSNLKTQYDNLIESLEKEYNAFRDLDKEAAIANLFEAITVEINAAASKAKGDKELYVSPDVDNYLKNTITAQMNTYHEEVLENASGTMSEVEQAAQKDRKTLNDLKSELDQAKNEYADYLQYVDETAYDDLCDRIEDWKTKVNEARESAKQTGEYTSPWKESELLALQNDANGFITALKNEKELTISINNAAEADRTSVNNAQKEVQNAINSTDQEYPAFVKAEDKKEAKAAIVQKLNSLSEDIDAAEQEALEQRNAYASPSVSEQLSEIESMVDQYQQSVAAAASQALEQAQTQAGADREQLEYLTNQVVSIYDTYNELGCLDEKNYETMSNIETSIDALEESIETALTNVMAVGSYVTPLTAEAIEGIEYTIGLFKDACNKKYEALVKEYANADRNAVEAKQDEYFAFTEEVHMVDNLYWDPEHEAQISQMLQDIQDIINNVANEAIENTTPYNNEQVQSYLQAIEDEIAAYKQSLIDQIIEIDALTIKEGEATLQFINEFYSQLCEEALNGDTDKGVKSYEVLNSELQEVIEKLNQTGEKVILDSGVEYDNSEVNELIKDVIAEINRLKDYCSEYHLNKVYELANGDLMKLNDTEAKYNALIQDLNGAGTYDQWRNKEMETQVASMLAELRNKINAEVKDAIDTPHAYNSIEKSIEEINIWIETYEKQVKGRGEEGLSNEEIDSLVAIDYEELTYLETRLQYIYQNYEEYLDMDMYDLLYRVLYDLYIRLEDARKEAYETHQYSTPWESGEILDLEIAMNNLERDAQEKESEQNGISNVEADPEAEAIYYDLNGRLIKNPTSGTLYIRVLGGKAQKVII